jgi:hypothetical protein
MKVIGKGRLAEACVAGAAATVAVVGLGFAPAVAMPANEAYIQQNGGPQLNNLNPKQVVDIGYHFQYVPNAKVTVEGATATISVSCQDNNVAPTRNSITVKIPDKSYNDNNENNGGWVPGNQPNVKATYQTSVKLGNYCHGGQIVLGHNGSVFQAFFYSNSNQKINVEWHFSPGNNLNQGGWIGGGPGGQVTPAPLSKS